MGWPLKTAEKELIKTFIDYITNNYSTLIKENILIWGASVRGTLLGILLEKYGCIQFRYVDNDERKWGENINGHVIVCPLNIKENISDYYILVPIEYGNEIKKQLESWGLVEKKNFTILQAKINEKYVEEFFREYKNKRLILGESFLNETILDERCPRSIKERIWKEFGKEETKILSMNCMGMQSFYHILRLQMKMGYKPETLWLFTSYETLTEFHHMLSRTQHAGVLELIQKQGNIKDKDFLQYINIAQERAKDYSIEFEYSPQRTTRGQPMNMEEIRKSYLKLNLMYDLSLDSEETKYMGKILKLAKKEGVIVSVILTPVNYELAKVYYGREFEDVFFKNTLRLKDFVGDLHTKFYDMSTLLRSTDYIASETINDGIYEAGQKKVIKYLKRLI